MDHKTQVATILVSIGQDFTKLGQLLSKKIDRDVILSQDAYQQAYRKKSIKRDANAPKKNVTSYLHYSNMHRDRLVKAHPDLPQTEIARLLGTEWRALTPEEKQVYVKMAVDDKARFDKEMRSYEDGITAPSKRAPATPTSPETPAVDIHPKKKAKKSKH
ncbi:hypothetical protein [Absidia glauca]|uniref:HMG box domain-containing protein n=1 Tax=Absidia glauca TaxID=4829 RepID=A0A168SC01_ABSGL|nr:hypothetical protein [Absidia glauca]